MSTCECVRKCVCACVRTHTYARVCLCIRVDAFGSVYVHACVRVCLCLSVHACVGSAGVRAGAFGSRCVCNVCPAGMADVSFVKTLYLKLYRKTPGGVL